MSAITGGGQQEIKDAVTASNTSVWAFHATSDGTVPVSNTNYYATNWGFANPNWRWTFYHGGSHATGWQQGSDTLNQSYNVDSSTTYYPNSTASSNTTFLSKPKCVPMVLK